MIDADISDLTGDFFGDAQFYNYENSEQAAARGVHSRIILDASDLVANLGMDFSMARFASKSSVVLGDINEIDADDVTDVVWANSKSANIDFTESQNDSVLIFTNTNDSTGDIVSLGGDYNDTIHAGANDTINAGGGDDTIYAGGQTHIVFDPNSTGDDLVLGWTSTDVIELDEAPGSMAINDSGQLVLSSETAAMTVSLESGSFTSSTDIRFNINGEEGIARIADLGGNVTYDQNVTYYNGIEVGTLVVDNSSATTIDLTDSKYVNIANIDASNATGHVELKGNSANNVIKAGKRASVLWGGGGNDTLIGGE